MHLMDCDTNARTHNDRGVFTFLFSLIKACCKCEINSLLLRGSEWAAQSDFFVSHVIITRYNESAARVHYQQDERETVEIAKNRQKERERKREGRKTKNMGGDGKEGLVISTLKKEACMPSPVIIHHSAAPLKKCRKQRRREYERNNIQGDRWHNLEGERAGESYEQHD